MAADCLSDFLVDGRWLDERRRDPGVVTIDTRPAAEFRAAHLEGARHFDPFPFHYADTSERGMSEFRAQLEWIFSALGITGRETAVAYENDSGMRAARTAWLLEYMGHRAVRILDGGLKDSRLKVVTAVAPITPSDFSARPREPELASYDYVVSVLGRPGVQILDVRTEQEYFAERVRARRGGAIPGAINREYTKSIDAGGRFKPAEELRAEFLKLGLRPENEIIPYCQGGYRSAHSVYALRRAGFARVRNYLGSWAEWGNRDDAPIEQPRRLG